MSLPRKLKNMNLFSDALSFLGECPSVTLPKLSRKTDEYRGGGMNGPVEVEMGMEKLEMSWTIGGYSDAVMRQFGGTDVAGVGLRFMGAYQAGNSAVVDAVEIEVRGFHKELDRGDQKMGEGGETKVTSSLSYYKETINGEVIAEIDFLNMIEVIDGVDRLADQRRAIGA